MADKDNSIHASIHQSDAGIGVPKGKTIGASWIKNVLAKVKKPVKDNSIHASIHQSDAKIGQKKD